MARRCGTLLPHSTALGLGCVAMDNRERGQGRNMIDGWFWFGLLLGLWGTVLLIAWAEAGAR